MAIPNSMRIIYKISFVAESQAFEVHKELMHCLIVFPIFSSVFDEAV
jgi:hypothetical protein